MPMQVVTNENFQQFVETRAVPEFKPPEAPADSAAAKPEKAEGKQPEVQKPSETARDESGRFTTQEPADKTPPAAAKADDDEGGDNLPEHARKVIGKKHRQMKEAEEFGRDQWTRAQAAEKRAEELQRQLEDKNAKSRPAAAEVKKKPEPKDFATVAEYTDALVEYRVAEKLQEVRAKSEREAAEQAAAERARQFGERIAKAMEKHPDYEEVVGSIKGKDLDRVPNDVVEYLQESEHGADLLYHLAKNPKDLDRFRKLSPRRFIAELGKLEAKFEAPAEPPTTTLSEAAAAATTTPKAVSKAPAPIEALGSDKSTVVNKDPATMSFQELREYERKRDAERRARR